MSEQEIAEALQAQMDASRGERPAAVLHALVDGALAPDAWAWSRSRNIGLSLCPPHAIVQPDEQWALPLLLPLATGAAGANRMYLRKTAAWALQADAATWVLTDLPVERLARGLAARQLAVLPQDMRASLRFADARVLPVLHALLHEDQAVAFFGGIQAWWYVDRAGDLQALRLPALPRPGGTAAPEDVPPLVLDQRQEAALLQAAEVDAVIALLMQHDARAAAMDRPQRFAFVAAQLQAARRWGIAAPMDQALYCMAAMQLGAGFDQAPAWTAALQEVLEGRSTLAQALERAA